MVPEKKGKKMTLRRVNGRLLLNYPQAILLFPKIRAISMKSMLSYTALFNVYNHVRHLEKAGIKGSIVEMGCWNGGCAAIMGYALGTNPHKRHLYLFDSFEGLPELTKEDASWAKRLGVEVRKEPALNQKAIGLYIATEEAVRGAFKSLGVSLDTIHIVKGWFQESVPTQKNNIGAIALLRLDGDTYESTKYCLAELYDQVVEGGVVIIDDYNLEGCRQALYEFFVERKINPLLNDEPFGGRTFFVKR